MSKLYSGLAILVLLYAAWMTIIINATWDDYEYKEKWYFRHNN